MSDAKEKLGQDWKKFTDTLVTLVDSAGDFLHAKADEVVREQLVRKRTELENQLEDVEERIVSHAVEDLRQGYTMGEVIERWQLPHTMLDDLAARAKAEDGE